jgi:hypothetical protein
VCEFGVGCLFKSFFGGVKPVSEFCRVVDCKGYNRVVPIKVNVKGRAGRDCPDDKESEKQEDDSEQVTQGNEVLVHVCLRTVQVVCFLRRRDVFKIR